MLLKKLAIRGLHTSLNLDIDFYKDLTMLVGINGSGKTSALNVIDWLLKPDIRRLARARFKSLDLEFEEGGTALRLSAQMSSDKLSLSIHGASTPMEPITVALHAFSEVDDRQADTDIYMGLSPEKHEIPLWNLLKGLPKPTFILLDRTISAESDEGFYLDEASNAVRRRVQRQTPIDYVRTVTSGKYAEYRAKAIENDNELKAKIVMSALQSPKNALRGGSAKAMTAAEIHSLEEKVATYLSATVKSQDLRNQVKLFFEDSRKLSVREKKRIPLKTQLPHFIDVQYRQIESLAKAFNAFETKNALAFKKLKEYLDAVNRFFKDSKKELFFDQSTGKLMFFWSKNSNNRGSAQSVAHLSSGERQILVLFTFLAFASNTRSIFIVDEPELSLHPKWQSEFLEAFLTLRPDETQLLLATHSPDVVGKFKGNCIALRERA